MLKCNLELELQVLDSHLIKMMKTGRVVVDRLEFLARLAWVQQLNWKQKNDR